MSDPVMMELLSAEYGWTPDQIRAMRTEDVSNYLNIINTKRKIEEQEFKKIRQNNGRK